LFCSGRKLQLNRASLSHLGVTPVTPFTPDLTSVDLAALEAHLARLVDAGIRTLFVAGHTGEVMSLSPSEWTDVVRVAVEVAAGRAVVVPGVAHELPVAVELAGRAEQLGADGVLLMPRSQPHASAAGMAAYWRKILDATSLPGVVYKKRLPDDASLLDVIADSRVVACKYGDTDLSRFSTTVTAAPTEIVWICGTAERYAPFFAAAGATGFTSGLANFAPNLSLEMQQALVAKDFERALSLRAVCVEFESIRAMHDDQFNVSAVKAALQAVGLPAGGVRPPLREVDTATQRRIRALAQQMVDKEEP
jgi:4-hydroxy-tetrahydrodipicolinate synthase